MQPLEQEMSIRYLKSILQASDAYPIPEQLAEYFQNIAAGNPKNIQEVAAQLRRFRAIDVAESGRVLLAAIDLKSIPLPRKLLGYTRAMIDRFQVRLFLLD